MKKTRFLIALFGAIVLVGVDLTIILKLSKVGFNNNIFVSLIFVNIGIIFNTIFLLYTTTKDKDAVVHGLALYLISYAYVVAEAELAIMFSIKINWKFSIAFLTQLVLLLTYAAYVILCIIGIINQKSDRKHFEGKVSFITSLKNYVLSIADQVDDAEIKSKLNDLAEKITYSDPMSDESLSSIENEIKSSITSIENGVAENREKEEICADIKKASILLERRNRLCQEKK